MTIAAQTSAAASATAEATPACLLVDIEIRPLTTPEDALAFRTLNEEWITRHFTLEEKDRLTLNDPHSTILAKGGHIFLVYAGQPNADQAAVGCVALIPLSPGIYELSKMAVSPLLRGGGIGRRLLEHTIQHARNFGAKSLILGSSTKLPSAVHL